MRNYILQITFFFISLSISGQSLDEILYTDNYKLEIKIDSLLSHDRQFHEAYSIKIDSLNKHTSNIVNYIEKLKKTSLKGIKGDDYETLDKPDYFNDLFFDRNQLSKEGEKFTNKIKEYRKYISKEFKKEGSNKIIQITSNDYPMETKKQAFSFLKNEFKDFPLITSTTKLDNIKDDIKKLRIEIFKIIISNR